MNTKTTKQESSKNLNQDRKISKTGYKVLFLLMELLKSPKSRDEILADFNKNAIIGEAISADSVTNMVNVLRKIGCEINRPSQKTNYCYVLESHPFSSLLTREDIDTLQTLRDSISTLGDWKTLINLNKLYKKLAKYAYDEESKNILIYNHKLRNINLNLLNDLVLRINTRKPLNLIYHSPIRQKENLEFIPKSIEFKNDKLYLRGYSTKHKDAVDLRIDRIKGINFEQNTDSDSKPDAEIQKNKTIEVIYKLKNLSALTYIENEDEEIIEKTTGDKYNLTVRAQVFNKFIFFQKILSYGTDCELIEPESIIPEFKKELANIKRVYIND